MNGAFCVSALFLTIPNSARRGIKRIVSVENFSTILKETAAKIASSRAEELLDGSETFKKPASPTLAANGLTTTENGASLFWL